MLVDERLLQGHALLQDVQALDDHLFVSFARCLAQQCHHGLDDTCECHDLRHVAEGLDERIDAAERGGVHALVAVLEAREEHLRDDRRVALQLRGDVLGQLQEGG